MAPNNTVCFFAQTLFCLVLEIMRMSLKFDDPALVKSQNQEIDLFTFNDGSGYSMDYDLTTDGGKNDLTLQIELKKRKRIYCFT